MEAQIQVFRNGAFGSVRVVEHKGEPWFVASDVAKALGYANPQEATREHCKKVNKITQPSKSLTSVKRPPTFINIIPESDVYRLVMRSNLPGAVEFQDWVCEEVIPTIRKSGGYLATKPDDTPETILARAVLIAQDTLKRVEAERDEALRTKAWIGSRREATAMATAASATRRAKALEAQLGLAGDYLAVKGIKWLPEIFDLTKGGTYSQIGKYLKRLSLTENYMVKTAPDSLHESVGLYHKDIIALFRKQLAEIPSLMRKYRHVCAPQA
ncbi:hypothetical protein HMPREF0179_03458 [Bilophila wadsworthia 3_1_6]|uniref:Bro-N domain-containing protein n=1 Tax=Bilophila wadsworthia (strain 3_1_6) TaxID=563192 RepID=E5YB85_BILW3|nr:BRO family protein [Bilophila wadsworthia]EFV42781.1 hypothetical protein HMPREF0179_03458 [Bilophila wadsworthia 3_1_6]